MLDIGPIKPQISATIPPSVNSETVQCVIFLQCERQSLKFILKLRMLVDLPGYTTDRYHITTDNLTADDNKTSTLVLTMLCIGNVPTPLTIQLKRPHGSHTPHAWS